MNGMTAPDGDDDGCLETRRRLEKEHATLVELASVFSSRLEGGRPCAAMEPLYRLIRSELLRHFITEEKLLAICRVDRSRVNARNDEHRRLLEILDQLPSVHERKSTCREVHDWFEEQFISVLSEHVASCEVLRAEASLVA